MKKIIFTSLLIIVLIAVTVVSTVFYTKHMKQVKMNAHALLSDGVHACSIDEVRKSIAKGVGFSAGSDALNDSIKRCYELKIPRLLITHGFSVNAKDTDGRNALMNSLLLSDGSRKWLSLEKLIMRQSVDVNAVDENGFTALMFAAKSGNMPVVKWLIQHHANLGLQTINPGEGRGHEQAGATALHLAAQNSSYAAQRTIALMLINAGAPLNTKDENGLTPLGVDIRTGSLQVEKALLERGATVSKEDLNYRVGQLPVSDDLSHSFVLPLLKHASKHTIQNSNALLLSIRNVYDLAIVKTIVNSGIDVNKPYECAYPLVQAMSWVIKPDRLALVTLLLKHGAKVSANAVNIEGTALSAFITYYKKGDPLTIYYMLLRHGLDVNQTFEGEGNPLTYALNKGDYALAEQMIKDGANVNARSENGGTPLMGLISSFNHNAMPGVRLLVSHGAKVNIGNPLIVAIDRKDFNMVKYLVNHGASLKQNDGSNAIVASAAAVKSMAILKYLLQKGANPNIKIVDEYSALANAVDANNLPMVKLLLSYKANPNHDVMVDGMSVLERAISFNNLLMVQLLISHGAKLASDGHSSNRCGSLHKTSQALSKYLKAHGLNCPSSYGATDE